MSCGKEMMFKNLDSHERRGETGMCPNRYVRCRRDWIGNRILAHRVVGRAGRTKKIWDVGVVKNFEQTVKKIIDFHPDRICLNYMHLSTKFHPHQLKMPKDKIPDENLRKELFSLASNLLENNHYARAGYDHFVSKDDKLYDELKDNKLKWNRLGIVTGTYLRFSGFNTNACPTLSKNKL